jgi:Rieske Fe-S protein
MITHHHDDRASRPGEPAPSGGEGELRSLPNEAAREAGLESPPRRSFLATMTSAAMTGGLLAGEDRFAEIVARYPYSPKPRATTWMFVGDTAQFRPGDSIVYRGPEGALISITRLSDTGAPADFVALSTTCPHLGCQVQWEAKEKRFSCPCHNGTFEPGGRSTGGPPSVIGQSLLRYPLKVQGRLLFIEVPIDGPM